MVKISHETPLCLLKKSLRFNNFQYCLPHLMESNKKYREHFLDCKKKGVEIYLDNSLHELGHSLDDITLLKWIKKLEPSNFFVPDVWEDKTQSIISARRWASIEVPENTTKVAVVQAKNIEEVFTCVQIYKDLGYKKLAFSYGASFYNEEMCPHPNKDLGKALGRLLTIIKLLDAKILDQNDSVHLLGTSIPQEFGWYKDIRCIKSIDTSNPIMATLDGTSYSYSGLNKKPKSNMNENFEIKYSEINQTILKHNILMFKLINNL